MAPGLGLAVAALAAGLRHAAAMGASQHGSERHAALAVERKASSPGGVLPVAFDDGYAPDGLAPNIDLSRYTTSSLMAAFSDRHVAAHELMQADTQVHSLLTAFKPHGEDSQEVSGHTANGHAGVHAPLFAYPTTFGFITCVIILIYGNRGWKVVLTVMAYLTALSTMKLAVKFVFVTYGFRFPKFVTALHFISGGLVCLLVNLHTRAQTGNPIASPTIAEFAFMITPIAMAASISIAANNMALGFSTVAFTEIIGATTCLFTVPMVVVLGMPFDTWLLIPTFAVAMGCALSTTGEVNFSLLGMVLCFVANAFRSLKVSLQQKLMTDESKGKFDPCTLLMWVSVPSALFMIVGSVATEGMAPYKLILGLDEKTLCGLLVSIGVSCLNAVILNLAQLFVTKDLGAVGGQLVAQAKAVLTVLGGMALFGEPVTKLELVGFAEVLLGVYMFSKMEARAKEKKDLERAKQEAAKLVAKDPTVASTETPIVEKA